MPSVHPVNSGPRAEVRHSLRTKGVGRMAKAKSGNKKPAPKNIKVTANAAKKVKGGAANQYKL
jgi:hypothetical protein